MSLGLVNAYIRNTVFPNIYTSTLSKDGLESLVKASGEMQSHAEIDCNRSELDMASFSGACGAINPRSTNLHKDQCRIHLMVIWESRVTGMNVIPGLFQLLPLCLSFKKFPVTFSRWCNSINSPATWLPLLVPCSTSSRVKRKSGNK